MQVLNFSHPVPFYIKSKVFVKYFVFVSDCSATNLNLFQEVYIEVSRPFCNCSNGMYFKFLNHGKDRIVTERNSFRDVHLNGLLGNFYPTEINV